jgi:serine phosphatase RsbU (regulator of sigma subunit)
MEYKAKIFARWVLMVHLLLLVIVIGLVFFASKSVYEQARRQALEQAEGSQELLSQQTADGIKAFYDSIRDDLDLIHRADDEQAAPASQAAATPTEPAPATGPSASTRPVSPRIALGPFSLEFPVKYLAELTSIGRGDTRIGNAFGQLLWWQLESRASLLFAVDPDRLDSKEPAAALVKNPAIHVIGPPGSHRAAKEISQKLHLWLSNISTPSVSDFQSFGDLGEGNVVCVPAPEKPGDKGRRLLVAFVPIRKVGLKFLAKLNPKDSTTSATLTDTKMETMVSSDPKLVGVNALEAEDAHVRGLAQSVMGNNKPESIAIEKPYTFNKVLRSPRMMTLVPVNVMGRQWFLMVSSKLSEVDAIVNRLFKKALYWAVFVVVAMTGILVSTSISLIRGRSRLERTRHIMLRRDIDQAREIQKAWLPSQKLTTPRVDISAVNRPANHISGDFYNWFELPDGRLVVTIGDVTGHGMSAAFLMATTQLLVRGTMMRVGDPGICMTEVNRQLCTQIFIGQFVTMLIVALDLERGQMQVATAGHYPPLLGDGSAFQSMRVTPQLVLGVEADVEYPTQEFPIPPHASLLLYTDGVLDVESPRGARFGRDGLAAAISGAFQSAQTLVSALLAGVDGFRGTKDLPDDLTFVAIQLAGKTPKTPAPTPTDLDTAGTPDNIPLNPT